MNTYEIWFRQMISKRVSAEQFRPVDGWLKFMVGERTVLLVRRKDVLWVERVCEDNPPTD